jgi:two-component system cell cycle sensor histidine kinase/response regulator CckA
MGLSRFIPDRKAGNRMENLHTKDTILLVDDEPVVLDVGALMVKKLGYNVLQAANSMEASQILRDNVDDICLVILDMILPDESGLDTCKKLKEIKSDVKVLHTSGLGRAQNGDALGRDFDGFLQKPFRIEELSSMLKDLLVNT